MKNHYPSRIILIFVLAVSLFTVNSCRKEENFPDQNLTGNLTGVPNGDAKFETKKYDWQVPNAWYVLMLRLVKETPGHAPPVAARELAYAGVALYEATLDKNIRNRTMAGQLNGLSALPVRQNGEKY